MLLLADVCRHTAGLMLLAVPQLCRTLSPLCAMSRAALVLWVAAVPDARAAARRFSCVALAAAALIVARVIEVMALDPRTPACNPSNYRGRHHTKDGERRPVGMDRGTGDLGQITDSYYMKGERVFSYAI